MKLSKEKFIDVFNDINKIFIDNINMAKDKIKDFSECELYDDFIETYLHSYRMINRGRILDGMVLLRNSFELMMILFGIRIDKNTRAEYCKEDCYERYQERRRENKKAKDYLSQSYLRNAIVKKYPNTECEYTKIYNILSKYAHPTPHRNVLRYYEREKTDVTIIYLNVAILLPVLFLEILKAQKIIDEEKFKELVIFKYIVERLNLIYLVKCIDIGELLKANVYAFMDVNKEYYDKQEKQLRTDFMSMEEDISQNSDKIKEALNKVLSKVNYYEIAQKLINLGIDKI